MTEIEPTHRWSVEQRLAFIERRLYWDGHINRSDLVDQFSISVPQASSDLSAYELAAPGNMHYDKSAKAYLASTEFQPRAEPSARQFLAQLQLLGDNVLTPRDSWLGRTPAHGMVPRVRRKLEAKILRRVLEAIRFKAGLEIIYQSMTSIDPSTRWIVPHALGFDGHRWHVRGWCHRREKFLDFVMARVLQILDRREENIDDTLDQAWHQTGRVRLGSNPSLTAPQRRAIALDYGMRDDCVEIEVRLSLVYYLSRQMLLDVSHLLPPERAQVVLLNKAELNEKLISVGESRIA
jgi:predicted DNA-binding transcriptional regulator YafY